MSYPSLPQYIEALGLDAETASDTELQPAFVAAFRTDLPKGFHYLEEMAAEVRATGQRIRWDENPNSELGREICRLVGTDEARAICERELGVAFGLYNCCSPVAAPSKEKLNMTLREQAKLQQSPDC